MAKPSSTRQAPGLLLALCCVAASMSIALAAESCGLCGINQRCVPLEVDASGVGISFTCKCLDGYTPRPGTSDCTDVNECILNRKRCGNRAISTCTNLPGSYRCGCRSGYTPSVPTAAVTAGLVDQKCVDIDECAARGTPPCSATQQCVNTIGSYNCIDGAPAPSPVVNTDPCNPATSICAPLNRVCETVGGVPQCAGCLDGRSRPNPTTGVCPIITDQCNSLGCSGKFRTCTAGATQCGDCFPGYIPDPANPGPAGTCIVAPTCASLACADKRRQCTAGATSCGECYSGFVNDPANPTGTCIVPDVDECARPELNDCDEKLRFCENQNPGPWSCKGCLGGFEEDPAVGPNGKCRPVTVKRTCEYCTGTLGRTCIGIDGNDNAVCGNCRPNFELADWRQPWGACRDIDECANPTTNLCAFDKRKCINVPESFKCGECNAGWYSEYPSGSCRDYPDCADPNNGCRQANRLCREMDPGTGYQCGDCLAGYYEDANKQCTNVVNECQSSTLNRCDPNAWCIDATVGYGCACKPGFMGDGFKCTRIDNCAGVNCGPNSYCVSQYDQYRCYCSSGAYWNSTAQACDVDQCIGVDCGPYGRCVDGFRSYQCVCNNGYVWDRQPNRCVNDPYDNCYGVNCGYGTCINSYNSYTCSCQAGAVWDESYRMCDLDDCRNVDCGAGRCIDGWRSGYCYCPPFVTVWVPSLQKCVRTLF